MAGKKLAAYVHVGGRVFAPGDSPEAEFAEQITNPKAWGESSDPESTSPDPDSEAPKGNASRDEWAAYATTKGAPESETAEDGLSRDELRDKYGA